MSLADIWNWIIHANLLIPLGIIGGLIGLLLVWAVICDAINHVRAKLRLPLIGE